VQRRWRSRPAPQFFGSFENGLAAARIAQHDVVSGRDEPACERLTQTTGTDETDLDAMLRVSAFAESSVEPALEGTSRVGPGARS